MATGNGEAVERMKLGEILVGQGALRADQVERVLARQEEKRRLGVPARFGEICVRSGWVEAGVVTGALSHQAGWVLEHEHTAAALIDMGIGDIAVVESRAQADAERRGWAFERVPGDVVLIRRLLQGEWHNSDGSDDVLVLQPGEQVKMTYDDLVIGCALAESDGLASSTA